MRKDYLQYGVAALAILALLVSFFALAEAGQNDLESMGLHPGSSSAISGSLTIDDIVTTDDGTIGDDLGVTGDLSVGDGTPDVTLNGEDAYVEGTFEVDGASEFDGAVNVDGAADFDLTVDIAGNVSDGAGTFTIADDTLIDGAADAVQLTAQGYTTQTSDLVVFEQSDGTDVFTIDNDGAVDIASTFNYGANDLYPVGYASSGQQIVYGTASVTDTLAAPHGLTTVTFCLASLADAPSAASTNAAYVTTSVSGNVCTLQVWQDDLVTASGEAGSNVLWLVIGAP